MNQPDYIVVGAGSAGCILARRLAQEFGAVVTIVEAPCKAAPQIDHLRPARWLRLLKSSEDWDFTTSANPSLANRSLHWPRGRGIGGSSRINSMIWFPPTASDLEQLSTSTQNHWSAQRIRNAIHSLEQILQPEKPRWLSHTGKSFLKATETLSDCSPMTYRRLNHKGCRRSLEEVMLPRDERSATWRSNIQVVRGIVDQVCWNNQHAEGIQILTAKGTNQVMSKYGVILAAGSIGTPSILMRSGVGSPDDLDQHGISTRFNSSCVGRNLRDHLLMPVIYQCEKSLKPFSYDPDPRVVAQWQVMGTGPLSSNLAECGGLFLNDTIQLHVTPTHYLTFPKSTNSAWMSIGVNLTQPRSQGSLQLSSANPMDPPKIDADYLHCEEDLEQMIRGVEYVREITKSKDLEKVITSEALPGKKRSTSEAIGKSILRYAQTLYHPLGTCAVGTECESVVDPQFRLRNASGIWIVDGSIFPGITVGNPNATIMGLAWIAVEEIAARTLGRKC